MSGHVELPAAGGTRRRRASVNAPRLLSLAATPVCAMMALLTAAHGGMPEMPGMPVAGGLSGMPLMYALMGAFHAAPWLRMLTRRGRRPD